MPQVDPFEAREILDSRCKKQCKDLFQKYSECAKRIESDTNGEGHCTGQYLEYHGCVEKCVAKDVFTYTK